MCPSPHTAGPGPGEQLLRGAAQGAGASPDNGRPAVEVQLCLLPGFTQDLGRNPSLLGMDGVLASDYSSGMNIWSFLSKYSYLFQESPFLIKAFQERGQ